MLENPFEFGLSFIDYTYLLYFYLKLTNKKWNWKRASLIVFIFSLVQFGKNTVLDFGGFSGFINIFLVTGFLYLYSKPYTMQNLFCALMLYSLYYFIIVFSISLAIEVSFDVDRLLILGKDRLIFAFVVKFITIIILIKSMKPFKALSAIMTSEMLNKMILIVSFTLFGLSYVYGNSTEDESIIIYTLFLTIIISFVYGLFYRYCVLAKKEMDYHLIDMMISLTSKHVKELEMENEQMRKMKHDYKNQLMVISELSKNGKFQAIKNMVEPLAESLETLNTSISGNAYVDAILHQKKFQYSDIDFKLNIALTPNFHFDGKDLVSLLTNIIDNACEELYRIHETSFQLLIMGNENQLQIVEKNNTHKNNDLKTVKDSKNHGYGLKIIEEIVRKYEGDLQISVEEMFTLKVFIIL